MSSIRKDIRIAAPPALVWDAVRDVGAVHRRLVPGVVVDSVMEEGARVVTFENGLVVRELIVDLDDEARRFAYSSRGGRASHHNASMQVLDDGRGGSILVWITDMLPDDALPAVAALVDRGAVVMRRTLEEAARHAGGKASIQTPSLSTRSPSVYAQRPTSENP